MANESIEIKYVTMSKMFKYKWSLSAIMAIQRD